MSFWRYVFDNELSQRADIETLKDRARQQQRNTSQRTRRTRQKVVDLEERLEQVEEQVGSLQLMNRVLLNLIRESPNWDEDRFYRLLYEIDISDGRQDGKLTVQPEAAEEEETPDDEQASSAKSRRRRRFRRR